MSYVFDVPRVVIQQYNPRARTHLYVGYVTETTDATGLSHQTWKLLGGFLSDLTQETLFSPASDNAITSIDRAAAAAGYSIVPSASRDFDQLPDLGGLPTLDAAWEREAMAIAASADFAKHVRESNVESGATRQISPNFKTALQPQDGDPWLKASDFHYNGRRFRMEKWCVKDYQMSSGRPLSLLELNAPEPTNVATRYTLMVAPA